MGKGTFYGLSMKTPVIYAEIQVLLMYIYLQHVVRTVLLDLGDTCKWNRIIEL